MFNYSSINKTPTVNQVKSIIKYMEDDKDIPYPFSFMMEMSRPEPNRICLNLNNAHKGTEYDIIFNEEGEILSFKLVGKWTS